MLSSRRHWHHSVSLKERVIGGNKELYFEDDFETIEQRDDVLYTLDQPDLFVSLGYYQVTLEWKKHGIQITVNMYAYRLTSDN